MDIYQKNTIKFLKKYGYDLARALNDTNIFIATPIAQSAIESGYGTSSVARDCNNLKGISWNATYSQGRCSGHSRWAKFATPYDCFRSYAYFVSNRTGYQKALQQTNAADQIWWLVYGGYCTSPYKDQSKNADNYLKTCKSYLRAMEQLGIGGKISSRGQSIAQFGSIISNLNIT